MVLLLRMMHTQVQSVWLPVQGAIYATDNGAYSWSAAVQETVDATLNRTVSSGISGASYYEGTFSTIQRSPAGDYVAVSSRGKWPLQAYSLLGASQNWCCATDLATPWVLLLYMHQQGVLVGAHPVRCSL